MNAVLGVRSALEVEAISATLHHFQLPAAQSIIHGGLSSEFDSGPIPDLRARGMPRWLGQSCVWEHRVD